MILSMARREVITAQPEDRIVDVAGRLGYYNVRCVVIVRDEKPVGIVTDRELALRALARIAGGVPIHGITIDDVMTRMPQTIREEESASKAIELMRSSGVRRLPVVDHRGKLRGLVTLDDLLENLGEKLSAIGGLVRQQQKGPKRVATPALKVAEVAAFTGEGGGE